MYDIRRIQSAMEIHPVQPGQSPAVKRPPEGDFAQSLQQAQELRFSAHALERMNQRGITLSAAELERLQGAVDTAAGKGSRASLVLLDERAFVVSVANRTVITALDGDAMKDQVVTQIDSAVIL